MGFVRRRFSSGKACSSPGQARRDPVNPGVLTAVFGRRGPVPHPSSGLLAMFIRCPGAAPRPPALGRACFGLQVVPADRIHPDPGQASPRNLGEYLPDARRGRPFLKLAHSAAHNALGGPWQGLGVLAAYGRGGRGRRVRTHPKEGRVMFRARWPPRVLAPRDTPRPPRTRRAAGRFGHRMDQAAVAAFHAPNAVAGRGPRPSGLRTWQSTTMRRAGAHLDAVQKAQFNSRSPSTSTFVPLGIVPVRRARGTCRRERVRQAALNSARPSRRRPPGAAWS